MWPNFDGKPYSRDALAARVNACDFSQWKHKDGSRGRPAFITLHNTSVPSIKLWLSWSSEKRQQYIHNMQPYYENMGWRGGPHFFVPPEEVCAFGFNDLMAAGTHASCFNAMSIGIEMVGEFSVEPFDSGPGAVVRDSAVYLMALLHNKIGLNPEPYVYGKSGLHFHVECKADNHDCPGNHVHKADVIARVKAEMARQKGQPVSDVQTTPLPPVPLTNQMPVLRQGSVGGAVTALQGLLKIESDAIFGPQTKAAVVAYQRARGLMADGIVGARTWASLRAGTPAVEQEPTPSNRGVLFEVRGKMSTFGGPSDDGMQSDEGLALFASETEMRSHGLGSYLLTTSQAGGASGLGRRLLPSAFYVACRWNTHDYPLLRDAVAHVINPKTGKSEAARPMDWGPNVSTGRVADLSPGLAESLGLDTNDECTVTVYRDGK